MSFEHGTFPKDLRIIGMKKSILLTLSSRSRAKVDLGTATSEDVNNRLSSMKILSEIERNEARDIAQKAKDCGGDRAPGPDGFTFKFLKTFWDVIKNDVIRLVNQFFNTACFPKGCNSSFIALIPKIGDAKYVSNFRPISLIGCQYKIIGKILANRLSLVIGSCISAEQSAFLKGPKYLDGPLILNECMAGIKKENSS
ncbi:hypothetical protein Tco_0790785 [Tanacetum coccineum]